MSNKTIFLHLVYFYPKVNAAPGDAQRLIDGINKHLPSIPGVLKLETGTPAGTPRDVVDNAYSVALVVEFADAAGHDVYADHPDHLKFIAECSPFWSNVKVYDSLVTRS